MKLDRKKLLASKVLDVGVDRIGFDVNRLDEIKEAITRQDIRDLKNSGAITVKEIKGRKKIKPRKRRREGKIKLKVNKRKKEYVRITKKLRRYVKTLKSQKVIDEKKFAELRKLIKNRGFSSKRQLKESIK
ncbi:MAG: 50S ribosomal protein L19e [Candidatus Pacearchaeota archaeon]